jgi:hypothetical protein
LDALISRAYQRRFRDAPLRRVIHIYVGKGRPASIDAARVREMKTQGLGPTAIAMVLGGYSGAVVGRSIHRNAISSIVEVAHRHRRQEHQ